MRTNPHPVTLRQLQYAVAVADLGSFRKAADACHVAQPSLSSQLAQLEQQLGIVLFERRRRGTLVTAAGQSVLTQMRAVLTAADDLVDAARAAGDPLAGELELGVIPTVSPYVLPLLVGPVRDALPRLSIRWVEDKTPNLRDALAAGRLDGALLALEADLGDVEAQVVAKDRFLLATTPDHPLARVKRPVRLADLADAPVLLLDDGHCLRDQALALCTTAKAKTLELRATSMATLIQMVASGLGVTLVPELAAPVENRLGGLVLRRFAAPEPHRTIGLVWRRHNPRAETLRTMARVMARALKPQLAAG
ncbi:MAG: LysR substrate-binding domain-containing protein [Myxococcota bacterium]